MRLTHKIAIAAVTVVLVKYILAGMELHFGTYSLVLAPLDPMAIAAILTPCLGAPHLESWVGNKREVLKDDSQNS